MRITTNLLCTHLKCVLYLTCRFPTQMIREESNLNLKEMMGRFRDLQYVLYSKFENLNLRDEELKRFITLFVRYFSERINMHSMPDTELRTVFCTYRSVQIISDLLIVCTDRKEPQCSKFKLSYRTSHLTQSNAPIIFCESFVWYSILRQAMTYSYRQMESTL